MRHQNVTSPDASPDTGGRGTRGLAGAPRPLGRAAVAMSTALSRAWSLPPRRNYVAVDRKLRVPMSDGTVQVSLIATAYRFGPGHRLRLQVAGGAHPRFARNPGNGLPDASPADLVSTGYTIGLDAGSPSVLLLSAPAQARAGTQGGAAGHA